MAQAKKYNVTMADPEWTDTPLGDEWTEGTRSFRVTLRHEHRQMTLDYHMGPALEREPTADDVLDCVVMDSQSIDNARDFKDWASDFGYDTDSRKAERIYSACVSQRDGLRRIMGDDYDNLITNWEAK